MVSSVLPVVLFILLASLSLQLFVLGRVRTAIDHTDRALRAAEPAAETLPLTETRIQLTELGFTVGPTTTINDRLLSMIAFRADGIIGDSSDTTNPRQPASTGFLTVFEGGNVLATQWRGSLPTLDDDVVQVLPDAPIDELLAAHVRGCRLMEAAGHARLRVPDEVSARTLVLHEIDHIRRRLKRMSHRDRMQLLRAQGGSAAAGHILSAHESLPPPPSTPTARITA
jgi:hypothetical protein